MLSSLRAIVERSATLWERLDGPFLPIDDQPEVVASRLDKWIGSTPEVFMRRLEMDGLTLESVERALRPVTLPADCPLPPWCGTLEAVVQAAAYEPAADTSIAFAEGLGAVAAFASRRIQDRAGDVGDLLSADARIEMERAFLRAVSALFMPAMASELSLARHLRRLRGETADDRYQNFLRATLGSPEALLRFFVDYPVLARLLVVRVDHWVDATVEFIDRLRVDLRALEACFHGRDPLGRVVAVRDSLSDPHRGGRTVKVIRFECGVSLLYKPKPLGLDAAFVRMLEWLNAQDVAPGLYAPRILNRGTYGWMEHVAWAPCADGIAVEQFYRRSGMLLGVLHALGATDSHRENVIAAGDSPVLIDMETLLRVPRPAGEPHDEGSAARQALLAQQDSVMSTGLLPEWRFGGHGRKGVDVGGMSSEGAQTSPFLKTKWTAVASDALRADLEHPVMRELRNRPTLAGAPVEARAHVGAIVEGFEAMYGFLVREHERFCAGPVFADLCTQAVRYINRPTKEYVMILERSLAVDGLRDGVQRSLHLDLLCRSLLLRGREHVWPLLACEREALERLDVPYLWARANSTTLHADADRELPSFLADSVAALLQRRLAGLCDLDMRQQTNWIRASFEARYVPVRRAPVNAAPWHEQAALGPEALIDEAIAIADQLRRQSVRGTDGTVTWMGAEFLPHAGQYQLQPMSAGVYGGLSGVAFFLAALHRSAPRAGCGDIARMAVRTLEVQRATMSAADLVRQHGVGGLTGVSSVAYALAWCARWLEDDGVMREAVAWANAITTEAIRAERFSDVVSGVAGVVPSLLTLHEFTGEAAFLSRAVEVGRQLLSRPIETHARSGFAHGPSGVAHALRRLHAASGEDEFLSGATRMFQDESAPRESATWCNGMPGVALARLDVPDAPEVAAGVRIACDHGIDDLDHLCCGNCGRIDVLLDGSRHLARSDWRDAAARQMAAVIGRARATGAYQLMNRDNPQFCPGGMFKGLAGIGYTCLRLADDAQALPSVLRMA